MQTPAYFIDCLKTREQGKRVLLSNISSTRAIVDIIRSTLGPRSMLKMLLDSRGGIVLTNDGNSILREIDVCHPAARLVIALSRIQDENLGDGTTSVVILVGEILRVSEPFLEKNLHPTIICKAYNRVLDDTNKIIDEIACPIDVTCREQMINVVNTCIGTKFARRLCGNLAELALDAVNFITLELSNGKKEIDFKRYAKIEKIQIGALEESRVLKGVMFNKDVVNPGRMRRKIYFPRILLLDCPLEYKKGENMTNVELTREEDFTKLLRIEEEWINKICKKIIAFQVDLVVTEKGLSDLAAHCLQKARISAIRRIRKSDNNRIAKACGAMIISRPEEIKEKVIGIRAGLFKVQKIGDDYFSFITDCKNPKACTIILRCASKDVLNEIERNLLDAMSVVRNVVLYPKLLPGGGATEMEISLRLKDLSNSIKGIEQWPYRAAALAMEVIPRTLAKNCGVDIMRTIVKLRGKHIHRGGHTWGIDGETGLPVDMKKLDIWEPYHVKSQMIKTAIESASMLLRIDDIVSGISKKNSKNSDQTRESQKGISPGDSRSDL